MDEDEVTTHILQMWPMAEGPETAKEGKLFWDHSAACSSSGHAFPRLELRVECVFLGLFGGREASRSMISQRNLQHLVEKADSRYFRDGMSQDR